MRQFCLACLLVAGCLTLGACGPKQPEIKPLDPKTPGYGKAIDPYSNPKDKAPEPAPAKK